jgi:membrane protein DedA with SNARE-associated domain
MGSFSQDEKEEGGFAYATKAIAAGTVIWIVVFTALGMTYGNKLALGLAVFGIAFAIVMGIVIGLGCLLSWFLDHYDEQ